MALTMSKSRCACLDAVLMGYVKSVRPMYLLMRSPAVGGLQAGGSHLVLTDALPARHVITSGTEGAYVCAVDMKLTTQEWLCPHEHC